MQVVSRRSQRRLGRAREPRLALLLCALRQPGPRHNFSTEYVGLVPVTGPGYRSGSRSAVRSQSRRFLGHWRSWQVVAQSIEPRSSPCSAQSIREAARRRGYRPLSSCETHTTSTASCSGLLQMTSLLLRPIGALHRLPRVELLTRRHGRRQPIAAFISSVIHRGPDTDRDIFDSLHKRARAHHSAAYPGAELGRTLARTASSELPLSENYCARCAGRAPDRTETRQARRGRPRSGGSSR